MASLAHAFESLLLPHEGRIWALGRESAADLSAKLESGCSACPKRCHRLRFVRVLRSLNLRAEKRL
jgi:hypothetical protein